MFNDSHKDDLTHTGIHGATNQLQASRADIAVNRTNDRYSNPRFSHLVTCAHPGVHVRPARGSNAVAVRQNHYGSALAFVTCIVQNGGDFKPKTASFFYIRDLSFHCALGVNGLPMQNHGVAAEEGLLWFGRPRSSG